MTAATITTKGRITIPAHLRKALLVYAGDRIKFVQIERGQFMLFATNRSATEMKGMFDKPTMPVTIEDMNRAIADRAVSVR